MMRGVKAKKVMLQKPCYRVSRERVRISFDFWECAEVQRVGTKRSGFWLVGARRETEKVGFSCLCLRFERSGGDERCSFLSFFFDEGESSCFFFLFT